MQESASSSKNVSLRRCCAFVLAFALRGLPAQNLPAPTPPAIGEQGPAYTLNVKTRLVTLDVVVNDKNGQPVRGLSRSDFQIFEDKIPQQIVAFEATAPGSHATVPIHSTAELDRLEPDAPVTIVVLDELTTRFEDQYFARYSLEKYLAKQGEVLDQPLTLMARNSHGTQVLLDYTTSRREVLAALNRHLAGNDFRATAPSQPDDQLVAEFASLIEIAKATEGHTGHKTLLWIGRGFPSMQRGSEAADVNDKLDAAIARCTNLLRDARVTLYTIDPAGVSSPEETLDAAGDVMMEDPFGAQVGFLQMAKATGGQSLHGRNDVDRAIETTVKDGQIFYSLAYRPSGEPADDKPAAFRRIKVVVKGGELTATTREGYYSTASAPADVATQPAPSAAGLSEGNRFDLAAASQGLMVFDGIPLTITRDPARPDTFHVQFPAAAIGLREESGKMAGKVSLIALSYDLKGALVNRTGRVVTLHLDPLPAGQPESRKLELTASLSTSAPAARVRLIVLGNGNGRIGADNVFLVDRSLLKDSVTGLKPAPKQHN